MDDALRWKIISAYGAVLEKQGMRTGSESELPYPKNIIRRAIAEELIALTTPELRGALEGGYIGLENFLSPEEYEVVKDDLISFLDNKVEEMRNSGNLDIENSDLNLLLESAMMDGIMNPRALEVVEKIFKRADKKMLDLLLESAMEVVESMNPRAREVREKIRNRRKKRLEEVIILARIVDGDVED